MQCRGHWIGSPSLISDETTEDALEQIRTKGYAEPWLTDGREIICVGVAFDPIARNIGNWVFGWSWSAAIGDHIRDMHGNRPKNGLFVIRSTGDSANIMNEPVFRP